MKRLRISLTLLLLVAATAQVAAQPAPYTVPRTEYGHPDLRGVWAAEFLTMLERPPGVEGLVASPEMAQGLVAANQGHARRRDGDRPRRLPSRHLGVDEGEG